MDRPRMTNESADTGAYDVRAEQLQSGSTVEALRSLSVQLPLIDDFDGMTDRELLLHIARNMPSVENIGALSVQVVPAIMQQLPTIIDALENYERELPMTLRSLIRMAPTAFAMWAKGRV